MRININTMCTSIEQDSQLQVGALKQHSSSETGNQNVVCKRESRIVKREDPSRTSESELNVKRGFVFQPGFNVST